eukprot:m.55882 g.55882  ORF g.55882 m.55882 type:complete len:355 (+) comp15552_c0_seq3:347-1411(+)
MDAHRHPKEAQSQGHRYTEPQSHFRKIPKFDLHRHLSGSFRQTSLCELLPKEFSDVNFNSQQRDVFGKSDEGPAWEQSLRRFAAVSKASEGSSNLRRLVAEAIEDLHLDNVLYCEFRIGIKKRPTKRQYLEVLIAEIQRQRLRFPHVIVKLLLSVARHKDVDNALETIEIAIEYFHKEPRVVCGVELGGVATKGNWKRDFAPLFTRARNAGLPVALHCGENADNQEEIADMIKWKPDRLGHCVFANDANVASVIAAAIPVEVCMECHHRSYAVLYKDNLLRRLRPSGLAVLATDNPSFLQSSLSNEFALASKHQNLSLQEARDLCQTAIQASFASNDEKHVLTAALVEWWASVP